MSDDDGGIFFDEDPYELASEAFPDSLSDEQFIAALDLIDELIIEEGWDWEDIYDAIYEDFWDWFRENYA